jgi:hypothetical protein
MSERPAIDREAIRTLVRQVLRDLLPDGVKSKSAAPASPAMSGTVSPVSAPPASAAVAESGGVVEVSLATDSELNAFVRGLAGAFADGRVREAVLGGRRRFILKRRGKHDAGAGPTEAGRGESERVAKGVVTERAVAMAAKAGRRLVLAKGVVMTPLARDRARALGVSIEREN